MMRRKKNVFLLNIKILMAKNAWIDFLVAYRKKHPKMSMKQAMKSAATEYRKKGKKKGKK